VPPIAYKLRSLSDLPGLMIQVARTPTQGVLVWDRIGACPYRYQYAKVQTGTRVPVRKPYGYPDGNLPRF